MNRGRLLGWGLFLTMSGTPALASPYQGPAGPMQSEISAQPLPPAAQELGPGAMAAPGNDGAGQAQASQAQGDARWVYPDRVAQLANQPVRPMSEGPLHEAFLSPRKDRNPVHVEKTPPTPISERPAVDPPRRMPSGSKATGNGTQAAAIMFG